MELVPEPVTPDRPDFSLRDLDDARLEQAVRLWGSGTAGERLAFSLADVLAAIAARQPALVALLGEEVVGAIAARVEGDRAWVLRWSVSAEHRSEERRVGKEWRVRWLADGEIKNRGNESWG